MAVTVMTIGSAVTTIARMPADGVELLACCLSELPEGPVAWAQAARWNGEAILQAFTAAGRAAAQDNSARP